MAIVALPHTQSIMTPERQAEIVGDVISVDGNFIGQAEVSIDNSGKTQLPFFQMESWV